MSLITRVLVAFSRVLEIVSRRRRDDRLTEEVRTHLELLTADYMGRGMTPADARAAARRAFGGVDQVTSLYRDQRGLPFVDTFAQDLRFAGRLLRRDRGFAVTAVLVLGIGIGVNNMLFTVLNAHTLRGLPIAGADRLVYLSTIDDRNADRGLSHPEYTDVRDAAKGLADLAAFTNAPVTVGGDGRAADRLDGAFVSPNAFELIGVQPVIGRVFCMADEAPGAPVVAMLGNGVWQSRYGGDTAILGQPIAINGAPATIVGVAPDRSGFPTTAAVWLPLRQSPGLTAQTRDARTLRVLGRVRDGVTIAEARAEVETILGRLSRDYPETNRNVRARVVPINERFLGRLSEPAWLAFMAVGCLVAAISSANVANLMLARSTGRAREFAIRTSLGATRRRILRQLLMEGAVLAAAGGTVGLTISVAGARLFRSAIPVNALPYWMDYSVDVRVIAALVIVSFATVFIFALLPAVRASKVDVNRVLKDGGRPGAGDRVARRWTTVFLSAEYALTVVLLSQVVVSYRTASPPLASDRAIDTRRVLTATLTLPTASYPTPPQRTEVYRRLDERIRAIPGVSSVSLASVLPLTGGPEARLHISSAQRTGGAAEGTVRAVAIGPRYFQTLGVPLIRGRELDAEDGTPGHAYAIVNERFAEQFFDGQDPIGRQITITPGEPAATSEPLAIVAIAANVRQRPAPDPEPIVYLPYRTAAPATMMLLLRGDVDTIGLAPLLRTAVVAEDASLPIYRIQTMADVTRDAQWNGRLSHMLVLVLTSIAVALSTVGLYAVTAHGVSQRTQEIGVRMALGAQPYRVVLIVVRRVLVQLTFGFLAGIVCTVAWSRLAFSGRADVTATDPQSLLAVASTLVLAAAVACFFPARRATRLDPVAAIRGD